MVKACYEPSYYTDHQSVKKKLFDFLLESGIIGNMKSGQITIHMNDGVVASIEKWEKIIMK